MPIPLISKIEPKNAGEFPILEDTHIEGGYRVVDDITARDAIFTLNRKEGMLVKVLSDGKKYELDGGITNLDWVESVAGSGVTSVNGDSGPDVSLGLTEVLTEGNTSGGSDIIIDPSDTITGTDGSGTAGSDLNLKGGDALSGNYDGGDLVLTPGSSSGGGVVGEVRAAGALNATGVLTVGGGIDVGAEILFTSTTAPSTGASQGGLWVSDGSGSLVSGDLYYREPSDGTITNLLQGASPSFSITVSCTVTEVVGNLVYVSASDIVSQAKADAFSTTNAIGVVTSKPTSTTCVVVLSGVVDILSGLTAGLKYYLSDATAGLITSTIPSASGRFVLKVGRALNATTLLLDIEPPVLLT